MPTRSFCCIALFIAGLLLISGNCAGDGRLPHLANRFPPHLMFLTPGPISPETPDRGAFITGLFVDYSPVFVNDGSESWAAVVDMEMTTIEVSLEYGLTEKISLSVALPFVNMEDGFLDHFLNEYHDLLNVPDYNREFRPDNEFLYFIRDNGGQWFAAKEGGLHPADATLTAKYRLLDRRTGPFQTTLGAAYLLKLPLGDETNGFGGGRFDHGVSLMSRFTKDALSLHLNATYILLTDPDTIAADVRTENIYGVLAGIDYRLNPDWSLSAFVNWYTSPTADDTGIMQLDDDSVEIVFGLTRRLNEKSRLEFGFSEDLTQAAPDFTVHWGWVYEFGK